MKPRTQLTGPCVQCGSPDTFIEKSGLAHWYSGQDGIGTICKKCYQRKNREIPKPGKCVRCGVEETKQDWRHEKEGTICIRCYNKERSKIPQPGLCPICKVTEHKGSWENHEGYGRVCKSCASWIRGRKIKVETLAHYSGGSIKCNYCGYKKDIDALQLDHIHGGGNKDRKDLGADGGASYMKILKKKGYPDGYQVLCANCHSIKSAEEKKNGKIKYFVKT